MLGHGMGKQFALLLAMSAHSSLPRAGAAGVEPACKGPSVESRGTALLQTTQRYASQQFHSTMGEEAEAPSSQVHVEMAGDDQSAVVTLHVSDGHATSFQMHRDSMFSSDAKVMNLRASGMEMVHDVPEEHFFSSSVPGQHAGMMFGVDGFKYGTFQYGGHYLHIEAAGVSPSFMESQQRPAFQGSKALTSFTHPVRIQLFQGLGSISTVAHNSTEKHPFVFDEMKPKSEPKNRASWMKFENQLKTKKLPKESVCGLGIRTLTVGILLDDAFGAKFGKDAYARLKAIMTHVAVVYKSWELKIKIAKVLHVDGIYTASGASLRALRGMELDRAVNLWHVISHENNMGGTVGIAYLRTLCVPLFNVGISEYYDDDVTTAMVIAHEMGHNIGAVHPFLGSSIATDAFDSEGNTGRGGIMDYDNSATEFNVDWQDENVCPVLRECLGIPKARSQTTYPPTETTEPPTETTEPANETTTYPPTDLTTYPPGHI